MPLPLRDTVLRHIAWNPGIARKSLLARMSNGVTAAMLEGALSGLEERGMVIAERHVPARGGRVRTTYRLAEGVDVPAPSERVKPAPRHAADRKQVLDVLAALGAVPVARLEAFMPGARVTLDRLAKEGLVEVVMHRMFRAKATLVARSLVQQVRAITIRPDLLAEHDAAHRTASMWVIKLRSDASRYSGTPAQQRHAQLALEMLKVILRAPFRYLVETPLADLAKLADDPDDPHERSQYMRAARRLEALGCLEVLERKGKGRTTTVRLIEPIPYPLEG